jgi:hypothetical protein
MSETNDNGQLEKKSNRLELIIVFLLGITAVATAWSTWQEGLHGSLMDQNYTVANNLTSEANSMYNEGVQYMTQDMMTWNQLEGFNIDYEFASKKQDADEMEKLDWKIGQILDDGVTDQFMAAIEWAWDQEGYATPFEKEGFVDSYFEDSWAKFDEAEEKLQAGNAHNTHGDNQGLVSVIYAIVLFLLGISATFKQLKAKYILIGVSVVAFAAATVFMFTIPVVFP